MDTRNKVVDWSIIIFIFSVFIFLLGIMASSINTMIIGGIGCFIGGFIYFEKNKEIKKWKTKRNNILTRKDCKSKKFDFSNFITVNKICIIIIYEDGEIEIQTGTGSFVDKKTIKMNQIVEFQIKTDKDDRMENTSDMAGGQALLGGIIFGNIGAIAGAVSGLGKTPINKLVLKFLVNDFSNGVIEIELFNAKEYLGYYSEENKAREEKIRLADEVIDYLKLIEKRIKINTDEKKNKEIINNRAVEIRDKKSENTMELKNVELIKRYLETNDLEYRIEIKRRGISEEIIKEVKKEIL